MAERGLDQQAMKRALGVEQGTLSDWLRDRRGVPEGPTLLKFAKVFRVSVDRLLVGVDDDYDVILKAESINVTLPTPAEKAQGAAEKLAARLIAAWPHLDKQIQAGLKASLNGTLLAAERLHAIESAPSDAEFPRPEGQAVTRQTGVAVPRRKSRRHGA